MDNKSKDKKPFYKLWWFWLIAAVLILIIISNIAPMAGLIMFPVYIVAGICFLFIYFKKAKAEQEKRDAEMLAEAEKRRAERAAEAARKKEEEEQGLQEILATMQAAIEDLKKLEQSKMTNKEMADKFIDFVRIFYDNIERFGDYKAKYNDDTHLKKLGQLNIEGIHCMGLYQDSDDREIYNSVTASARKMSERNRERSERAREIRRQEEERELRLREVEAQERSARANQEIEKNVQRVAQAQLCMMCSKQKDCFKKSYATNCQPRR